MPDKSVRDFVAVYLRPHRPRLALLAVLFFAGIGLQLANPQLAKTFIDQASAGAPLDRLIRIAGVFLAVALLTQVATVAEVYVAEDLGWRTTNALRVDLTAHVLALDDGSTPITAPGLLERIDGTSPPSPVLSPRFVFTSSARAVLPACSPALREDWRIGVFSPSRAASACTSPRAVRRRRRASLVVNADLSAYLESAVGAGDLKATGADTPPCEASTAPGKPGSGSTATPVSRRRVLRRRQHRALAATVARWRRRRGYRAGACRGGVYFVSVTRMLRMPPAADST